MVVFLSRCVSLAVGCVQGHCSVVRCIVVVVIREALRRGRWFSVGLVSLAALYGGTAADLLL